jgi:NAD(P)-dependent dehydrogenase (short-subunit alcohol dehydrogenase family)
LAGGGDPVRSGLASLALRKGDNLTIGLEAFGGDRTPANQELGQEAVELCLREGRKPETPEQAAYPALSRHGGAVINLGSGQGMGGGGRGTASYAAVKEGIRALPKVAAREWGKDGIRVNKIFPGAWSESLDASAKERPEEVEALLAQSSLGRFADGYKDAGRLAVLLARPDCFMTGQTFHIGGGQLMP